VGKPFLDNIMRYIVIVGAGITGLTLGYELAKKGLDVVILEKEKEVGGLARSFKYGDFTFDIGPHRFYSPLSHINQYIKDIIGDEVNIIPRYNGVYIFNKYYAWPLNLSVLLKLPFNLKLKSIIDLFTKRFNTKQHASNLEDYILNRYGPTLYHVFFSEYTHKFLGISPKDLDPEWAKVSISRAIIDNSISANNLLEVLKLMLLPSEAKLDFLYPKTGINYFPNRLKEKIAQHGAKILTDKVIDTVEYSKNSIDKIHIGKESFCVDKIIWTAPITEACRLLNLPIFNLKYLSLILYNVTINNYIGFDYQWCYFSEKKYIFSRISNLSRFSSLSVPAGKTGLCLEVTSQEDSQLWNNPEKFVPKIKEDLLKTRIVEKSSDILSVHIEKIPNAYPIYRLDYRDELRKTMEHLTVFDNFIPAGRTGLFWYNNMDDSIANGLNIAQRILGK